MPFCLDVSYKHARAAGRESSFGNSIDLTTRCSNFAEFCVVTHRHFPRGRFYNGLFYRARVLLLLLLLLVDVMISCKYRCLKY